MVVRFICRGGAWALLVVVGRLKMRWRASTKLDRCGRVHGMSSGTQRGVSLRYRVCLQYISCTLCFISDISRHNNSSIHVVHNMKQISKPDASERANESESGER